MLDPWGLAQAFAQRNQVRDRGRDRLLVNTELMVFYSIRLCNLTVGSISGNRPVLPDSQAVDSKEGRYPIDDQDSPVHVDDKGEKEIGAEIEQLNPCTDHRESESWEIGQNDASKERGDEYRPVREWLFQEMSQDDLGGHTPKHKRNGRAVKDESVFRQYCGVGRKQPREVAASKRNHGYYFLDKRCQREVLLLSSGNHVVHAAWKMGEKE